MQNFVSSFNSYEFQSIKNLHWINQFHQIPQFKKSTREEDSQCIVSLLVYFSFYQTMIDNVSGDYLSANFSYSCSSSDQRDPFNSKRSVTFQGTSCFHGKLPLESTWDLWGYSWKNHQQIDWLFFFFRTIDIESKRRAKERQYLAIAKHIGPEAGGQEVSSGCWCPFVSTFYSTRQQAIP